jgi:hypothetical protein
MKRTALPLETILKSAARGSAIICAFSYCRVENKGLPCHKIMDCWYQHFMIEDFLRKDLKPEEWERFSIDRKPKVLSLIELIEEAKKTKQQEPQ